ncbi:MAG: ribonuclease R [Tissierellia bacterium]|nr:ribonuclease R [Tissierellia bacterium]
MLEDKILKLIEERGRLNFRALASLLEVDKHLKNELRKTLKNMERKGKIFQNKKKQYQVIDGKELILGKLEGNEKGFAFLLNPDGEDIFIDKGDLNTAVHGDEVLVRILPSSPERPAGKVLQIIKRGKTSLVGTFQDQKDFGFVLPDEKKFAKDIFIDKEGKAGAKNGQKVVVNITKWPEGNRNPEGVIEEIIGNPGDKGVDVLSIAKSMGFPMKFPKKVLSQGRNIPQKVLPEEIENRKDYRDITTFTIDGQYSKDFDDAVSIEMTKEGNYRLGVHIADVAHYVKKDSPLDKEAYLRGNSVYLLDEVIPMLPVELSNGICSLNPNEDRLTLSIIMEINPKGQMVQHEIGEGVIRSKRRLVYDRVSDFLEEGKTFPSLEGIEEDLKQMGTLAKILRKKRDQRGSIDFDLPEREIILNEEGKPTDVHLAERREANRLIEEFMLLANETVAEQYFWMDVPFLYRIHEEPDEDKIKELNIIMRPFGYKLHHTDDVKPMEIKQLLESIAGKKESPLIEMMVLRSLKKAKYSSEIEGHFGLASKYYTHFTSPIRRYNDLTIHRIIKELIHNKMTKKDLRHWEDILPGIAEHISATEKLAQEGERAVEDVKLAQYMADKIGETFDGIISGITNFGIFVQLENTIEGLISFKGMDEYMTFDEDKHEAIGRDTNVVYTLGQKVKIEVDSVNTERGQIDFKIVGGKSGKK